MSYIPGLPIVLFVNAVGVSITGTTAETTLRSFTLKGGMFGPNDIIECVTMWSYTNVARNKTCKVKIGTSIYQAVIPTTTASLVRSCNIINRNSTASQVVANPAGANEYGTSVASISTLTEDVSVDKTFSITGQPSNVADTITLEATMVRIWKNPK